MAKRTLLATLPLTIVALLGVAQGACSNGANGSAQSGSRQGATAVLQSRGLGLGKNSAALRLRPLGGGTPGSIPLTLVNVTGEADSLLILHNGTDSCGFEAWAARSQPGPVAVAGRAFEPFDLGDPKNWTSTGGGLNGRCDGGKIIGAEAYFATMDVHLDATGDGVEDYVVRISTGETGPYKFGDVLIEDEDDTFKWIDTAAGDALRATRPSAPLRYEMRNMSGPLSVPYKDGSQTVVLTKLPLGTDADSLTRSVTPETRKVVFEVDFSTVQITTDSLASRAALAKGLHVPFLTQIRGDPSRYIRATITPLTASEIGGPNDPSPGIGNGTIVDRPGPDAGGTRPDAGASPSDAGSDAGMNGGDAGSPSP